VKSHEFKEIRGWILKILYNNLPGYGGDQLISSLLNEAGYEVSPLQVQGHFRYLADKDYVELKNPEIEELGLTRHLAKLTSKGVDLVEGNLPDDPGVMRK
jgi:hypothetical protein